MNMQEEWAILNNEVMAKSDIELAPLSHFIKKESGNLLDTLKKGLDAKMAWARGIGLTALLLAVFAPAHLKYWLIGMFLVYEISRLLMVKKKRALNYNADFAGITRDVIADQLKLVKSALKIEEIWGYIFLTLAGPAGAIVYFLHAGKTYQQILDDPKNLCLLIAFVLFGIPGIYLAKKMNYHAFGKHIEKLTKNLQQFEE